MARYLYSELASTVDAMHRCEEKPEQYSEWASKHDDTIDALVREHMPSGSGFDSGTKLDCIESHAEKLVFTTSFHHMNDGGFNMRISGRNRNDIKDYIHDVFSSALNTVLPAVTRDGNPSKA